MAGDGATTATVLAQAIYREGVKAVTSGANPMAIKRGIDKAVAVAVEEVKRLSKPVTGDMIAQVGTISANSDPAIGGIIADAMKKVLEHDRGSQQSDAPARNDAFLHRGASGTSNWKTTSSSASRSCVGPARNRLAKAGVSRK